MALRHLQVRWTSDTAAPVARLRGDVDADAAPELRAIGAVADEVPAVVVDLSAVDFVDLSGLDLLDELAARTNVTLQDPSAPVQRLLARTSGMMAGWSSLRSRLTNA